MCQSRCTAKNSWWWAERLPETCRVVIPIKSNFSASVGFVHHEIVVVVVVYVCRSASPCCGHRAFWEVVGISRYLWPQVEWLKRSLRGVDKWARCLRVGQRGLVPAAESLHHCHCQCVSHYRVRILCTVSAILTHTHTHFRGSNRSSVSAMLWRGISRNYVIAVVAVAL